MNRGTRRCRLVGGPQDGVQGEVVVGTEVLTFGNGGESRCYVYRLHPGTGTITYLYDERESNRRLAAMGHLGVRT